MSSAIDPGRLAERLILLRPVITADSLGGTNTTYVVEDTVWAMLDPSSGSTGLSLREQQPVSDAHYRFLLRYRDDVVPGWSIGWCGETFYIEGRVEMADRAFLAISVKKRSGA